MIETDEAELSASSVAFFIFVNWRDKMSNGRYDDEIKRYKLALVILVSILFVVIFAFSCMIGALTRRGGNDEIAVTTTLPPVTEPPVVRISSMVSNTDSGTLIVVNNEHHCQFSDTASLVTLKDNAYYRRAQNGMQLLPEAVEKLDEMFSVYSSDMKASGVTYTPYIKDAYRDYATQEQKYNSAADKSTASVAGGSDLHTGYSFRLRLLGDDGLEYQLNSVPTVNDWLKTNMSKYGFVDRYPENGTTDFRGTGIVGYGFYRYVGLPHSLYIDENGISLEDYVAELKKDYSIDENPEFTLDDLLAIEGDDTVYYVMHVTAVDDKAEFSIPESTKIHSFSGDNMGGFVVVLVKDAEAAQEPVGDGTDTPALNAQE